jgi:1-acyl-sn-glycerol-3-phosphate acyltransferase
MLAHRAHCPVVPVAHNAGEYWGKNGFLKYPGVIEIHIGPALDGLALGAAELNRQAEDWIESTMVRISGQGPNGERPRD